VEFCHAWIKSQLGRRQFHGRGLKKVQMEMRWACLTYNLPQWIGLSKLNTTPAITCKKKKSLPRSETLPQIATHKFNKLTLDTQSHAAFRFLHGFNPLGRLMP
jgi:hypothetical protein